MVSMSKPIQQDFEQIYPISIVKDTPKIDSNGIQLECDVAVCRFVLAEYALRRIQ